MFFRRIGCVFARVALINIGDLDCFAGLGLHSLGKFGDKAQARLATVALTERKPDYTTGTARDELFFCNGQEFPDRFVGGLRAAGVPGL